MKTLNSPILFKQIIGRGTRIDPDTGKLWFRIIDYTGAVRLIDELWDKPPSIEIPTETDQGASTAGVIGTVRVMDKGDIISGATAALLVGPNNQRGPILTDENGRFQFSRLPAGRLTLIVSVTGMRRRQMQLDTRENETTICDVELKPEGTKRGRITVKGLDVIIADEATFIVEGINAPMTLTEYLDYTKSKVRGMVTDWASLLAIWREPSKRQDFVEKLTKGSIYADVLAEVLNEPEVDEVDLLGYLAFDRALRTRYDRTLDFRNHERRWLESHNQDTREVIYALLSKYELGGLRQITDPAIFRVAPFQQMGEVRGVIRRFNGDPQKLRQTMNDIQYRLYPQ